MAKKKSDQEEEREGVLAHQGDAMTEADRTSENDLARSEDYNPEDDVVPFHAPEDPDEVEGVLSRQPTVSDPQGMDDVLTFEGEDTKPKSRSDGDK